MATDLIRYDLLVQDALRGVVRTVLTDAARNGLQGDHHFFITFKTDAPGLRLSDRMRERYPDEMTIILQHQFWDLAVTEHAFEVGLSFSNKPERLLIPFAAITTFHDPSVEFGLKFDLLEKDAEPSKDGAGEVVALTPPTEPSKLPSGKRTLAAVGAAEKPTVVETPVASLPAPAKVVAETRPTKSVGKLPVASEGPGKDKDRPRPEGDEPQKVVSIDAFRKKP